MRIFSGEDAPAKTVYDMAMGTSQMLTCMEERVHALDKEAEIICYGQEINLLLWYRQADC